MPQYRKADSVENQATGEPISGRDSASLVLVKQKSRSEGSKEGRFGFERKPCGGYFMRHVETGVIVPARCNSHLCPTCSPLHQMTARIAIEQGMGKANMAARSEVVIFGTLTEPPRADLDLNAFRRRWQRTVEHLRRKWGMSEYAVVLEFQKRGALHPHFFGVVPRAVATDLTDARSRASYRRRMHELRPMAEALGWGQMVDAQTVKMQEGQRAANYTSKKLAEYATKEAMQKFKVIGAKNIRPTRLSYGWLEGGLKRAREIALANERMSKDRLEGPWERIRSVKC